jgi:hypothetical protein
MKLKKVVFILIMPFVAEVIIACCSCPRDRGNVYTHDYLVVNHVDNSGIEPRSTYAEDVSKHSYGIGLVVSRNIFSMKEDYTPSVFQAAQASCDCPPDRGIVPADAIKTIEVFSEHDFDVDHPAQSDVSNYFRVLDSSGLMTIQDFISYGYSDGTPRESRWTMWSTEDRNLTITLLLMEPPEMGTSHKFNVRIMLTDGRSLEAETTSINLI